MIGRAINSGRLLYRDIWDNKPPILYLYYSLVNGDLFFIRLFSLIFGAASIVIFFFVARNLFQGKKLAVYLSTSIFAVLFGMPLIEGNIANSENFMLLPILSALFFILKLKANSKSIIPLIAGFFLSIAFLTKIVAVFDLGAFLVIIFTLRFYNKSILDLKKQFFKNPFSFLSLLKQEGIVILAFILPILITFIFFFFQGALTDYLRAVFSQNVGYVGYANRFIIPQGLLVIKLILLAVGVIAVLFYKQKLGVASVVIYTWLIFSLFNAFFSGRPYTHYVLVFLPAFCLLVGLLFASKKHILFNIFLIIFLIALVRTQFNYYTNIAGYYSNYINFVIGDKTVVSYQTFFDSSTPRNYEIANFIRANSNKNDSVFILSDSSTIYYLADKLPPGRYIVEYHISFYKDAINETRKAIGKANPKFFIITNKNDSLTPNLLSSFTKQYLIQGVTIYER